MKYLFLILIFAIGCAGPSYIFWTPNDWAKISADEASAACAHESNVVTGGAGSYNFKRNKIFNSCMQSKGFKKVTVK